MEIRTPENTIRVFPRRTAATPTDANVFVDRPPNIATIEHVHVSVAFTGDIPKAERLADICRLLGYKVEVGGPAYGLPSSDFQRGMYLAEGYVITSRGCDRKCKHCKVPQREGGVLNQLPIVRGHNILDDNLLACKKEHILAVFEMLKAEYKLTGKRPLFTGGLEAKRLKPWHVDLLRDVKTERMYFAYDTPSEWQHLLQAGKLLHEGGISSHKAKCYILCGFENDTFEKAEKRIHSTWEAGFTPYVMQYMDDDGNRNPAWSKFLEHYKRPQSLHALLKKGL